MKSERYEVPAEVVARRVGDELVILHLETGLYFGLDGVGAAMWEQLAEGKTVGEVESAMLGAYEVTAELLERDLREMIEKLESKGLLAGIGN